MKWVRALHNLPQDGEEVLIRSSSIVNLAVFDKQNGGFKLKDNSLVRPDEKLQWLQLVPAGQFLTE
jgi:hypothetical protein